MGDARLTLLRDELDAERKKRIRQASLFETFNATTLLTFQATSAHEMIQLVSDALKPFSMICTVYALDGDTLSLTHSSVAPELLARIESIIGFEVSGFQMPLSQVELIRQVIEHKQPMVGDSAVTIHQTIGEGPGREAMARAVSKLMGFDKMAILPVLQNDQVAYVLVALSNHLQSDDLPALQAFANQLSAALDAAVMRQALNQSFSALSQIQNELLHTQKLEAVGNLAGGIAHDLNNLLTPILAISEALLRDELSDDQREDITVIRDAALRAADTTRRVLTFARTQSVSTAVFDLREVVIEVVEQARRSAPSQIELEAITDTTPLQIEGDRDHLVQMALNLVLNGIEAISGQGAVHLSAQAVEATHGLGTQPFDAVQITCRDTGAGISTEARGKLFDPFFTTKTNGVGLGLSVAHGIVKNHGGWFTLAPDTEPGTCITVTLPRADGRAPTPHRDPEPSQPHSAKILVVEDRDEVARATTRMLEYAGYTTTRAATLAEAHPLIADADLLLCDVDLPDGLSWPLANQPRPTIFVTGLPLDVPKGLTVLRKPYQTQDLLDAIEAALRPVRDADLRSTT